MSSTAAVPAAAAAAAALVPARLAVLLIMVEEYIEPSAARPLGGGGIGVGRGVVLGRVVEAEVLPFWRSCWRVLACRAWPSERRTRAAPVWGRRVVGKGERE
jgi:hypothetical protein